MYLLFAVACLLHAVATLIPFSFINNISISVKNSNFISVFFKHIPYANPSAEKSELDQAHSPT